MFSMTYGTDNVFGDPYHHLSPAIFKESFTIVKGGHFNNMFVCFKISNQIAWQNMQENPTIPSIIPKFDPNASEIPDALIQDRQNIEVEMNCLAEVCAFQVLF